MSTLSRTLRNYAELGRISNLPTIISNVLAGSAIGLASSGASPFEVSIGWRMLLTWLALGCLYVAGMAMNDVLDARIDAQERPHRPIPSGRISSRRARRFIFTLIILGLGSLAILGARPLVAGVLLLLVIVSYNFLHARWSASVVLMGIARGLVYVIAALVMAAAEVDWDLLAILAGALAVYTICFSSIARREAGQPARYGTWLAELVSFIAIAPAFIVQPHAWNAIVLPLVLAIAWLSRGVGLMAGREPATKRAVMIWISGICLVDGLYLAILGYYTWWIMANACFLITTLAHRRIAGT